MTYNKDKQKSLRAYYLQGILCNLTILLLLYYKYKNFLGIGIYYIDGGVVGPTSKAPRPLPRQGYPPLCLRMPLLCTAEKSAEKFPSRKFFFALSLCLHLLTQQS